MEIAGKYEKSRFDKSKAKLVRYSEGDFVLLNNSERHKTKLDPKFRGPFQIIKVLDNDRYMLKCMKSMRQHKYPHESLRIMPYGQVPSELEIEESPPSETVEADGRETVETDGRETVETDGIETVATDGSDAVGAYSVENC